MPNVTADRKSTYAFLSDGYSKRPPPICHHLRDFRNKNLHGPLEWVQKMPNKRPYMTSHQMTVVVFALSVAISETFTVKKCPTLPMTFKKDQDSMCMCHLPILTRSYLMKIKMFAISNTVFDIVMFNHSNSFDSNI